MANKAACYYVSQSGVLIEKNLRALIQHRDGVLPFKPVPKPAAQTPKQYVSDSDNIGHIFDIVHNIMIDTTISADVKMIIELQMLTGCRISEALSVDASCVTKQGNVKIHGLKGSEDRYVTNSMFRKRWQRVRLNNMAPGHLYSRFYFYRLYMSRGLYLYYKGDNKRSVTHAFRKLRGNDFYSLDKNLQDTRKSLGQKSLNSARYYVKS